MQDLFELQEEIALTGDEAADLLEGAWTSGAQEGFQFGERETIGRCELQIAQPSLNECRPGLRAIAPKRLSDQALGDYYRGRNSSSALGAGYEGIYRLPDTATASARSGSIARSNASKASCPPAPNAARRSCRWARRSCI